MPAGHCSAESAEPGGAGGLGAFTTTRLPRASDRARAVRPNRSNPEICWRYLRQLTEASNNANPNRGHEVLAKWEKRFDRMCVLTQNVDGKQQSNRNTRQCQRTVLLSRLWLVRHSRS